MRGWFSRDEPTTKRVFVAVIGAWFGLSYFPVYWRWWLTPYLYVNDPDRLHAVYQAFDQGLDQHSWMLFAYYTAVAMAWPAWWLYSVTPLGLWLPPYGLQLVIQVVVTAMNALLWATLITVAFVLVRRLRERRVASTEA